MNRAILATIFSIVMLATPALAWNVDIDATVDYASAVIWGGGGAAGCYEDCPTTRDYYLSSTAGIINGNGDMYIDGFGWSGLGVMFTDVGSGGVNGDLVFADQDLTATVCQDPDGSPECCPVDTYDASSSVTVEGADDTSIYLQQGTGVYGPYTGWFTTGQTLTTYGTADGDFDAHMTATRTYEDEESETQTETHTMGAYGTNIDFSISTAYQGMRSTDSHMYGIFANIMCYGDVCW